MTNRYAANIRVELLVERSELDHDDRGIQPVYTISFTAPASSEQSQLEELALDQFHATVPVSMLEHFDIYVDQIVLLAAGVSKA